MAGTGRVWHVEQGLPRAAGPLDPWCVGVGRPSGSADPRAGPNAAGQSVRTGVRLGRGTGDELLGPKHIPTDRLRPTDPEYPRPRWADACLGPRRVPTGPAA